MVSSEMSILKNIIISLRPYQWSKNFLVFAALIFSGNIFVLEDLKLSLMTFMLFSLSSGSIYLFNDIIDRNEDVIHPAKKLRPVASGQLPVRSAAAASLIIGFFSIIGSFFLSQLLACIFIGYIILTVLYTLKLKHIVILDIVIVALGFVLRAIAGAVVINVKISPWLLVCTLFLALFIVIGKRRHEFVLLQENAVGHRKILKEYNLLLLDQMIVVATATSIVSYALYTLDNNTINKFHTEHLVYTIPFVIMGMFRYFFLIYKKNLGDRPEKILLNDKGILVTILLWIITIGIIIY
jgi:4-hydroxybenzoate polyprenyltransferase